MPKFESGRQQIVCPKVDGKFILAVSLQNRSQMKNHRLSPTILMNVSLKMKSPRSRNILSLKKNASLLSYR
ncbi:MAG TPA: hypothetical protein VHA06_12200 [Candidatus Angelobacter sp.]|jgi:hypothetical protein|nr:hypothetical protein [Candidatus Angelobacter sp.]